MSHLTIGAVSIRDLAALETAAKEFGGTLVRNQSTYRWYGRRIGNDPLPEGIALDQLGKCSHAIRLAGVNYEIGVVRQSDGGFRLLWDEYNSQPYSNDHDGHKLVEKFGQNLSKLQQSYSKHATINAARKAGYFVRERQLPNGTIKLQLARA